ncbi:transglycosylase SLT domain-containing protein [Phenylobacterium sp.]|uniref:transglycosylase SLT domain-containing protein n=1 Tax=Phenylobacterium sp. TaxID=1871053 RepID=UPI0035AF95C0
MAIQGIRGVVEAAIQRASSATGVDFGFLMRTAARESGYNPKAKAGSSSAAGLFQFVEQTWLSTLKQHGAKYGYARYADLIQKGPDGRYSVPAGAARKAVMDLRFDPHAASLMAGELAADHASYLRGRTGRSPTAGELYAAHFLGPQGSARLIEAMRSRPGAAAAGLFPDAAAANRNIFYPGGRAATVAEVYANLTRTGGAGPAGGAAVAPNEDDGFVQYASARRMDRVKEQDALVQMILRGSQSPDTPDASRSVTGSLFTSEMLRVLADARDKS